jgi:hypothetical protein
MHSNIILQIEYYSTCSFRSALCHTGREGCVVHYTAEIQGGVIEQKRRYGLDVSVNTETKTWTQD